MYLEEWGAKGKQIWIEKTDTEYSLEDELNKLSSMSCETLGTGHAAV
jgi:hypothetical protein